MSAPTVEGSITTGPETPAAAAAEGVPTSVTAMKINVAPTKGK
jgi:hypothetical protein